MMITAHSKPITSVARLRQVKTTGKSVITDWTADAVMAGRHHGTEQVLFQDAAAENVEDGFGCAVDEVLLSAVQDAAKKARKEKGHQTRLL